MAKKENKTSFSLLKGKPSIGWKDLIPFPVLSGYAKDDITYTLKISVEHLNKNSSVAQAVICNKGTKSLKISSIKWRVPFVSGVSSPVLFPEDLEPFYFSTENYRSDFMPEGSIIDRFFIKPYPGEVVEIGWSEDRVFPGVFIGSFKKSIGLFCAFASQKKFHSIFRLRGGNRPDTLGFEIMEFPAGVDYISIAPGETFRGEKIYFSIVETNDPQMATSGYYKYLRTTGIFDRIKKKKNSLANQRIWCSWNYDFFAEITEKDCFKQIPILKKHFPSVKFLQVDDGYQKVIKPKGRGLQRLQIDFLYKNKEPFNKEKFPSGPSGFVKKCKEAGLRPAIWLGLWATTYGRMLTEHPDWTLLDDTGRPVTFSTGSYGSVSVLDPSVPGVRNYLEYLCKKIFKEWGFEGIKLDFSSTAFESKRVRFRYPGKTAVEWRKWLVDVFRKYLPEDGFFGWCSVAGTANPFLAPEADYFRNAEDIGKGSWDRVKRIATWCVNTNILMPERPVFPNVDSVGFSKNFKKNEWMVWLTLCAITGYAVEVSGDLTKLNREQIRLIRKTLEVSNLHRKFRCLDLPYREFDNPPSLWVAEEREKYLIAIFNWGETALKISSLKNVLKEIQYRPKTAISVFEKAPLDLSSKTISPHSSILFYVEKK